MSEVWEMLENVKVRERERERERVERSERGEGYSEHMHPIVIKATRDNAQVMPQASKRTLQYSH